MRIDSREMSVIVQCITNCGRRSLLGQCRRIVDFLSSFVASYRQSVTSASSAADVRLLEAAG